MDPDDVRDFDGPGWKEAMSKLGRLFRWILRTGAVAVAREVAQDQANPGNKAKKAGLRLVEKDK